MPLVHDHTAPPGAIRQPRRHGSARLPLIAVSAFAGMTLLQANGAQAFVSSFGVTKTALFTQTSPAQPTTPTGYQFEADLFTTALDDAATAGITWQGPSRTLTGPPLWSYVSPVVSKSSLDATFPSTTYTLSIGGGALGPQSGSVTLHGDAYPLDVPWVLNYAAAQAIAPDADFVVGVETFEASSPLTTETTTLVSIQDLQGSPVYFNSFGADVGQFVIPAGTLDPGMQYTMQLRFSARTIVDNAGFDGAFSIAAFDHLTQLAIATTFPAGGVNGDVDGDMDVDFTDLGLLLGAYGTTSDLRADFDDDGIVGFDDLGILLGNYQSIPALLDTAPLDSAPFDTAPLRAALLDTNLLDAAGLGTDRPMSWAASSPASHIPEPSACMGLAVALAALRRRRTRAR